MRDHRSIASSASPWVQHFISGVQTGGTMLDVACGSGRHLRLGLEHGLATVGVDRSVSGVADLRDHPRVELIEADIESAGPLPFAGRVFDLVVVTNYLWRPILPDIIAAVSASGLLIYETFANGQEELGRPKNPDFLLRSGELLAAVSGHLTPLAYEHVRLRDPERIVQRICAADALHRWCREGAPVYTPQPTPSPPRAQNA